MIIAPEETAFEQGYKAYYNDIDDCPYDCETQFDLWCSWCDGHMAAYCIGECK